MNCTMGQGYHFARPMDSGKLARQLQQRVETHV
jgi:EAL domain-containing protein (putative c-di-GMP-specific phosphodiesterase class I)